MNRARLLFIGVIALALGGLLSSIVYRALRARTASAAQPGVDVIITANDIQVGSKLEDRDLKVVRFPDQNLPAGVFKAKTRLIGRGVILPLVKGEFILPSKLAAENAGAGLPALIPPGMRAVSVRVNEVVAVAGFVVPGTRVDVLLTGNSGSSESQTTTVLSDVAVLAAGQRLERNSAGEPQSTPVITLLVSPEDAQRLTLASSEGRIQLALRNPLDTGQEKIPSARIAALYGALPRGTLPQPAHLARSKRPAAPAPLPTAYTVEVIRGNKTDYTKFDQ